MQKIFAKMAENRHLSLVLNFASLNDEVRSFEKGYKVYFFQVVRMRIAFVGFQLEFLVQRIRANKGNS